MNKAAYYVHLQGYDQDQDGDWWNNKAQMVSLIGECEEAYNAGYDAAQMEQEFIAGVSTLLRGNPLEIEARYRAMEKELEELRLALKNRNKE